MPFQHVFQDIPDNRVFAINNFFSRFYRFYDTTLNQFADNERLEQLGRHVFGQTAFVQFEFRAHHNYRTAGVVNPLTKQILTETALLSFEHITQRLEGAVAIGTYGIYFT